MARGRKPLLQDQIQGLCLKCKKNKQMPGPISKYGYKKFLSWCSSCLKSKYNLKQKKYQKNKKPHCERCGFIGDACQLDVHHKDRNKYNHLVSNLETLCANCHRLEHKEERKSWGLLS